MMTNLAVLKWAGGKRKLASRIETALDGPCEGTYFEPFVGSASVFLYLKARGHVRKAVLADVNHKLMSVHRALRDDVEGVLDGIAALPSDDWRDRYYEVREAFNEGPFDGAAHAARFLWLNRAGYNGLYRENRSGRYNVPRGSYTALRFPKVEVFLRVSELLQGTELISASFEQLMSAAGEGDQVYCDPPYVPLSDTASFTAYSQHPFGPPQQEALAASAQAAAHRGARVVLSNHDLPLVRRELYPQRDGFSHESLRVHRAISRSGSTRGRVGEILAAIGPMVPVAAK